MKASKTIKGGYNKVETVSCGCCGAEWDCTHIVIEFSDGTTQTSWVNNCPKCGGMNGENLDENTSYALVKGEFSPLEFDAEFQRYYDMTYIAADGSRDRRHGWYDIRDNKITQVG